MEQHTTACVFSLTLMHKCELAIGQSPDQRHFAFAGYLTTFQINQTPLQNLNLISWFPVFDFTKNIKQAGYVIFSCAFVCQKLLYYGIYDTIRYRSLTWTQTTKTEYSALSSTRNQKLKQTNSGPLIQYMSRSVKAVRKE